MDRHYFWPNSLDTQYWPHMDLKHHHWFLAASQFMTDVSSPKMQIYTDHETSCQIVVLVFLQHLTPLLIGPSHQGASQVSLCCFRCWHEVVWVGIDIELLIQWDLPIDGIASYLAEGCLLQHSEWLMLSEIANWGIYKGVEAGDNPPGKPLASPRGGYRIITILLFLIVTNSSWIFAGQVLLCAGTFQSHIQHNKCGETCFKLGHLHLLLYDLSYLKHLLASRTFHRNLPHKILRKQSRGIVSATHHGGLGFASAPKLAFPGIAGQGIHATPPVRRWVCRCNPPPAKKNNLQPTTHLPQVFFEGATSCGFVSTRAFNVQVEQLFELYLLITLVLCVIIMDDCPSRATIISFIAGNLRMAGGFIADLAAAVARAFISCSCFWTRASLSIKCKRTATVVLSRLRFPSAITRSSLGSGRAGSWLAWPMGSGWESISISRSSDVDASCRRAAFIIRSKTELPAWLPSFWWLGEDFSVIADRTHSSTPLAPQARYHEKHRALRAGEVAAMPIAHLGYELMLRMLGLLTTDGIYIYNQKFVPKSKKTIMRGVIRLETGIYQVDIGLDLADSSGGKVRQEVS
ncbi:hypothetical protein VP01_589g2 [Puccinia sorghi]|uniref:Uncharacterized protein n=1 Tax=Puccinia sorghi TaxID=27349 RepID=A0A0L6UHW5_9BASI|nr:hypothetical protein VP01_589g2 [Puccinia sorghi]